MPRVLKKNSPFTSILLSSHVALTIWFGIEHTFSLFTITSALFCTACIELHIVQCTRLAWCQSDPAVWKFGSWDEDRIEVFQYLKYSCTDKLWTGSTKEMYIFSYYHSPELNADGRQLTSDHQASLLRFPWFDSTVATGKAGVPIGSLHSCSN